MKQKLNHRIILLIKNSDWFTPYALEHLRLNECKYAYEIIERVLLNVSAKVGRNWKDIYHSKFYNPDLFSQLCIALILIDRGLKEHLNMTDEDVTNILGAKFSQILEICNTELTEKR